MKNNLFIFLFIALTACSKVVEIDVPFDKPSIVVNSIIQPDTFMTAKLSLSNFILDSKPYYDTIMDATVEVYEDGNYLGALNYENDYNYSNHSLYPKAGSAYELRVAKPGYEMVTAKTTVPKNPPQFEIINIQDITGEYGNTQKELTIKITDIPDTSYYEFFISQYQYVYLIINNVSVVVDSTLLRIGMVTSNLLVSPDGDSYYSNSFLFDDVLFQNTSITLKITLPNLTYNYTLEKMPPDINLYISMRVINEDYYKYIVSLEKQQESEWTPFAEPVFVYNNINNGLGIFSSYREYSMDTIVH